MDIKVRGKAQPQPEPEKLLPQVSHVVAVASGKGGVGKSTTSVNLAIALAQSGAKVGLLDADIYGPNVPQMMGVHGTPAQVNNRLLPFEQFGVKMMSLGFFVPADEAVIWRGPMVHQAITQLLRDVNWGELDFLLVDLPPGTGDAQLSLVQSVPLTGVVIVCTPQPVALSDAMRGLAMFQKTNVPVLGIVENMAYFACPHCSERTDIFAHGGARSEAARVKVPFLGEVPLDPEIRIGGDEGRPIMVANPESPQAAAYRSIAVAVQDEVKKLAAGAPSGSRANPIRLTPR